MNDGPERDVESRRELEPLRVVSERQDDFAAELREIGDRSDDLRPEDGLAVELFVVVDEHELVLRMLRTPILEDHASLSAGADDDAAFHAANLPGLSNRRSRMPATRIAAACTP